MLPPKVQPPVNNTSTAQPASSGQPQAWAPDGEQAQGAVSTASTPTPTGATSGQVTETNQGGSSEAKGSSSTALPANTPAENPEL